jgi:hypothetical protein
LSGHSRWMTMGCISTIMWENAAQLCEFNLE